MFLQCTFLRELPSAKTLGFSPDSCICFPDYPPRCRANAINRYALPLQYQTTPPGDNQRCHHRFLRDERLISPPARPQRVEIQFRLRADTGSFQYSDPEVGELQALTLRGYSRGSRGALGDKTHREKHLGTKSGPGRIRTDDICGVNAAL